VPNEDAVFGAGKVDEPTMPLQHALRESVMARRMKLEHTPGRGLRLWHLSLFIPLLSLYFALAFYHLDHQSLWTDEVISVMRATSDEPLLSRGRWFSGQSPPYFILLHLWTQQGTSEFTLRVLSVLLGGITIYLTYIVGFQLCNLHVAMLAATLLATSPFLIWYSQEVRYVIFMIPIGLLILYTFKRALHAQSPGHWLLYCGSVMLAIATFVVNAFLPLAQGLYLVCSPSRRPVLRKWAVCQLAVVAFFLWWANEGHIWQLGGYWQKLVTHAAASSGETDASQAVEPFSAGGAREFTLMALPYTFFVFSAGFSLGPSLPELHASGALATLVSHAVLLALSTLLFGVLFILGLASLWRQSDSAGLLVLWLVIPLAGTLAISAMIPELAYNARYVAVAFPAYILILAAGIAGLRRPRIRYTLLAVVLLFNGLSLAN
jgi:mannosyltransferase